MPCKGICVRSDMDVGHRTPWFTSKKPSLTWVIGQSGRWGLAITNVSRLAENTDIIDCSNTGSTVAMKTHSWPIRPNRDGGTDETRRYERDCARFPRIHMPVKMRLKSSDPTRSVLQPLLMTTAKLLQLLQLLQQQHLR